LIKANTSNQRIPVIGSGLNCRFLFTTNCRNIAAGMYEKIPLIGSLMRFVKRIARS
jgi:hypothetical protein